MTDLTVASSSTETATASPSARTISGRIVPFGLAGQTAQGRLMFGPGSLSWSDPKRVKLLLEHDQRQVVGHAVSLEERDDGIYGEFTVPAHPLGDTALVEASHGLRDAFSVGVQLDDDARKRLRGARGVTTPASGALREVSLVSVPAFDDARVENVAAAGGALTVSAWTDSTDPDPEHPAPVETPSREDSTMTPDTVEPVAPTAPDTIDTAPAVVQAAAGAALVTASPATYTFDGNGPSLIRDAYSAQVDHDPEAAERIARFNAELTTGNPSSVMALAAVAKRSDLPELVNPSVRRPDLMVNAIDLGRPVWSRLNPVTISNAQPMLLPIEGEFDGVGAHTEGTAHVAEGTLTIDEVTATPRAVSGAYRISRELADSGNPAADTLVVRAMIRDYRRKSETYAVTQLTSGLTAVLSINTVAEVRAELIDFDNDNDYPADFIIAGAGFFTALANEVDGDGRPMLPYLGPTNAPGQIRAGYTGATIDGVEVVRGRSSITSAQALAIATEGVLAAESGVQTFRFEQPEGPGIIKLALWAYQLVKVVRAGSVRLLTTASS